jgi:hypothetical protein
VSWWVWLLIAWGVLAVGVGVVVGMGIRAAERRELGHDRAHDDETPGDGTHRPDDADN